MSTDEQLYLQFSLDEIKEATNNFEEELIIGRGGFGFVYRGFINNGAKFVAIKRLSSESNQGETEFLREIEMLSRVQHDNLVCLEGYCNESSEKILVYEYMPNGTLVDHLYKRRGSATNMGDNQPYHLTWEQRLNISIGAAQGLDFLHRGVVPGVIHRDIKDSNILLDSNLRAKIADFGLAKLVKMTNDPMITSASTTLVKGTFGYLDPEYFRTQRLTTKTDVYAFGVVLLVLLSGRPAVNNKTVEDERSLSEWATKCIVKKRLDQIIDPDLVGKISSKSLQQFVRIAQKCLCRQSEQRPTMEEVVAGLQLALNKQTTTSNSSSRQSGGMSSLTQMATWWNVKFHTQKKDPSGNNCKSDLPIVYSASQGIQKHSGIIPQFGQFMNRTDAFSDFDDPSFCVLEAGEVQTLQLAPKEQPTTAGSGSRKLGGWSSSTQKVEAKLKIMMNEKEKVVVKDIISRLLNGKELSEAEIRLLCVNAQRIFLSESSLLELQGPITICGGIHRRQYRHLLDIFKYVGFPPSAAYLFLGNYDSLQTMCLLLAYKIMYPDKVFLLRGNHDDAMSGLCNLVWKIFTDCFNCLPVAALVDDKIFCVHGGLSPDLKDMKQIIELPRPTSIPDSGLLHDLLWSHPSSENGWGKSARGHCFGADKVLEFLQTNGLDLICRGHLEAPRPTNIPDRGLFRDLLWSHPSYKKGWGNSDEGDSYTFFETNRVADFLRTNDYYELGDDDYFEVKIKRANFEFFAGRGLVSILSVPYYGPSAMLSVDESLKCSFQTSSFQKKINGR